MHGVPEASASIRLATYAAFRVLPVCQTENDSIEAHSQSSEVVVLVVVLVLLVVLVLPVMAVIVLLFCVAVPIIIT